MWRRKPGFDVCSGASSARGGRAHLVVARLYAVAVPGTCSHSAKCILPVAVLAAVTKLLAGHGMIDVTALHALTTVASRGWDAGVGAFGSQAKLTTANKVCVRQAEVGGHRDCVEVSPCVAAAETVHVALALLHLFGCNTKRGGVAYRSYETYCSKIKFKEFWHHRQGPSKQHSNLHSFPASLCHFVTYLLRRHLYSTFNLCTTL